MTRLKAHIGQAKEQHGMMWILVHGRWVSIDKPLFDHVFSQGLIERYYANHNKKVEHEMRRTEDEIRKMKRSGKELEAKSKEYHLMHLKTLIKRELKPEDLHGKTIVIDIL